MDGSSRVGSRQYITKLKTQIDREIWHEMPEANYSAKKNHKTAENRKKCSKKHTIIYLISYTKQTLYNLSFHRTLDKLSSVNTSKRQANFSNNLNIPNVSNL